MSARIFAVFTEHNRYGPQLRGVFTSRDEAEKLTKHFEALLDGWKLAFVNEIEEISVAESYEQWKQNSGQFDLNG